MGKRLINYMWRQAFYLLDPTDLQTCRQLTEKISSKSDSWNITILESFLSLFFFFFWPYNKDLSPPTTNWTYAPSSRSVESGLPGEPLEGFPDVAILGERVRKCELVDLWAELLHQLKKEVIYITERWRINPRK